MSEKEIVWVAKELIYIEEMVEEVNFKYRIGVKYFNNPSEALGVLLKKKYPLIVTDLVLNEDNGSHPALERRLGEEFPSEFEMWKTGLKFIEAVRQESASVNKETPIIVATCLGIEKAALRSGATAYVDLMKDAKGVYRALERVIGYEKERTLGEW